MSEFGEYLRQRRREPADRRTTQLVGELTLNSPEFATWWSQHKVLDRTWGHKRFSHPIVGALEIDYEALHLPGDPTRPSSSTAPLIATPAPRRP
jgi:hypothetical protein